MPTVLVTISNNSLPFFSQGHQEQLQKAFEEKYDFDCKACILSFSICIAQTLK